MPIQSLNCNFYSVERLNQKPIFGASECSAHETEIQSKVPTKVKAGVMLATLTGITAVMAAVFKLKKIPCNRPSKFIKGLTSITYKKGEIELLVTGLAVGSVGGGLLGGAIFDKKENFNAKYKEAIIQMVGNIFMPLVFVAGGMRGFEKLEKRYPNVLKSASTKTKILKVITSGAFLVAGIFTGNKAGNTLNKKAFHCEDKRKIKLADMSPHLDDLCLATSLIAQEIKFVPRLIPIALIVAGYSTGTVQEQQQNSIAVNKKDTKST